MQPLEQRLSQMHTSNPYVMTPSQRKLYAVQDACRQENNSSEACSSVQQGISAACDNCRRRAATNLRDEGAEEIARSLEDDAPSRVL